MSNLYYLIKLLQLSPAYFIYTPFVTLSMFVALSNFRRLINLLSSSHPFLSIHFFYVIYEPYKCTCTTHHTHTTLFPSSRAHALCANILSQLIRRRWPSCHSDYGGGGSDRGWGFPHRKSRFVLISFLRIPITSSR